MSVVAEFTIPVDALPGGDALAEMPDVRVELDRIVPTGGSALPFFWVWGARPEAFVERAEADPELADVTRLARVENGALYRAEWSPNSTLIDGVRRLQATIVEAVGTADGWRFQVRTREEGSFDEFQRLFDERDVPVRLVRLYDLSEYVEGAQGAVTPQQREALLLAYREGYFESPRETSQAELGEAFGVSHRAVSDRLRRGTRNLIAACLLGPDSSA